MRGKVLSALLFILCFSSMMLKQTYAQIKPNAHIFRARVLDKENDKFLPYALVRIQDSNKNYMTNSNGDCEIEIPYSLWRAKKISFEITCSGYQKQLLTIKTKRKKINDVYTVKLKAINHKSSKL